MRSELKNIATGIEKENLLSANYLEFLAHILKTNIKKWNKRTSSKCDHSILLFLKAKSVNYTGKT